MNLHKNNEKKRKTSADKRNPKFIAEINQNSGYSDLIIP